MKYRLPTSAYTGVTTAKSQTLTLIFRRLTALLTLSALFAAPASAWWWKKPLTPPATSITATVAASGGEFDHNHRDYDILLNAVVAAGLDAALDDPAASLTVFAPSDKAFIRLARDLGYTGRSEAGAFETIVATLTELGAGDPIPVLTNILLYHVSPGEKRMGEVLGNGALPTLLGDATILPIFNRLIDNDPEFANPRLRFWSRGTAATNGVIYQIDRVLIPADLPAPGQDSLPTLTGTVAASGGDFDHNPHDFDILLNAVVAAGLADALDDPETPLTVFAPDDAAFIKLARDFGYHGYDEAEAFDVIAAALTELGDGELLPVLTNVLLYHVAPGAQTIKDLLEAGTVTTLLEGATFDASLFGLVDNAPALRDPQIRVRQANLLTSNGRIHPINRVLIPVAIP